MDICVYIYIYIYTHVYVCIYIIGRPLKGFDMIRYSMNLGWKFGEWEITMSPKFLVMKFVFHSAKLRH